jgi:hypothetical protein
VQRTEVKPQSTFFVTITPRMDTNGPARHKSGGPARHTAGGVEDKVVLEIKSVENIIDAHIAQTLNYLKATGLRLAIILNFSKEKLEYKRIVKELLVIISDNLWLNSNVFWKIVWIYRLAVIFNSA